jgi:hypothetical protein
MLSARLQHAPSPSCMHAKITNTLDGPLPSFLLPRSCTRGARLLSDVAADGAADGSSGGAADGSSGGAAGARGTDQLVARWKVPPERKRACTCASAPAPAAVLDGSALELPAAARAGAARAHRGCCCAGGSQAALAAPRHPGKPRCAQPLAQALPSLARTRAFADAACRCGWCRYSGEWRCACTSAAACRALLRRRRLRRAACRHHGGNRPRRAACAGRTLLRMGVGVRCWRGAAPSGLGCGDGCCGTRSEAPAACVARRVRVERAGLQ